MMARADAMGADGTIEDWPPRRPPNGRYSCRMMSCSQDFFASLAMVADEPRFVLNCLRNHTWFSKHLGDLLRIPEIISDGEYRFDDPLPFAIDEKCPLIIPYNCDLGIAFYHASQGPLPEYINRKAAKLDLDLRIIPAAHRSEKKLVRDVVEALNDSGAAHIRAGWAEERLTSLRFANRALPALYFADRCATYMGRVGAGTEITAR